MGGRMAGWPDAAGRSRAGLDCGVAPSATSIAKTEPWTNMPDRRLPRGCYSFTEQVSQLKDKDDLAKYASEMGVQESDNPAGSTHRHTLCT